MNNSNRYFEKDFNFEKFYHRAFPFVHSIVKRLFRQEKNEELVDDVTYSFFIKRILEPNKTQPFFTELLNKENQEAFLFVCVKNFCLTELTKVQNEKKRICSIDESNAEQNLSFSLSLIQQEDSLTTSCSIPFSIDLKNALERLNERQRLAIVMTFEGYDDSEIGEVLKINSNAVAALKDRARKNIRKFFSN